MHHHVHMGAIMSSAYPESIALQQRGRTLKIPVVLLSYGHFDNLSVKVSLVKFAQGDNLSKAPCAL